MATNFLAVALGGSLGAVARYTLYVLTMRLVGPSLPLATFAVNLMGSFAMGLLVEAFALRWSPSAPLRLLLTTGFLGAFTTFSTFSLDLWLLIERGRQLFALAYALASVILGLLALLAGLAVARRFLS